MKYIFLLFFLFFALATEGQGQPEPLHKPTTLVKKTGDFELTGDGSAAPWTGAEWVTIPQRNNTENTPEKAASIKLLYSEKGLYMLFYNEDRLITTPFENDFENLWLGDVVEAFLWTNQAEPTYFEYEITPLDYELPLIVTNIEGELFSWIPFLDTYKGDRKIRHKTSVVNGVKENGAEIDSWTAEIFIPYEMLHPLKNRTPKSGTTWRANFYRVDYDDEEAYWSWSPFQTNFHDYQNYGVLIFE